MQQTIRLPFHTLTGQQDAARFVAMLVRENITFTAEPTADGIEFVITFTGGY